MVIILISILWTAVVFGGSIGAAALISKGIDNVIGVRANEWYDRHFKKKYVR